MSSLTAGHFTTIQHTHGVNLHARRHADCAQRGRLHERAVVIDDDVEPFGGPIERGRCADAAKIAHRSKLRATFL
jgi:hypothetical protein